MKFLLLVADISDKFKQPKGMWESIINGIYSFGKNYGLTILLLTLFIKLAMTPMDFWQKYTQKMSLLKQNRMKPELDGLNKRYAYDKNTLNQKTMEVYKKHGVSPMGSCFSMLINMAVTLVVFITLISAVNKMSAYRSLQQYFTLEERYTAAFEQVLEDEISPYVFSDFTDFVIIDEESDEWDGMSPEEQTAYLAKLPVFELANEAGQAAVLSAWKSDNSIRESFLWIKNIWRNDTKQSVIASYSAMQSKNWNSKTKSPKTEMIVDPSDPDGEEKIEVAKGFYYFVSEDMYDRVMGALAEDVKGQWNGYYIMTVLAGITTFLSIWIMNRKNKVATVPGQAPAPGAGAGKMMMFIMPAVMIYFTLSASSTFALYLVVSQILSIVSTFALSPLVDKLVAKKEKNKKEDDTKPKINYSR